MPPTQPATAAINPMADARQPRLAGGGGREPTRVSASQAPSGIITAATTKSNTTGPGST